MSFTGRKGQRRLKAVLYRGTGCDPKFMRKAAQILERFNIRTNNRCWIKLGIRTSHMHTKKSIAYLDVAHYNIKKGKYFMALGHSAGGFPAAFTDAKIKVGFNPFFTQYPLLDVIFHARDDWLVAKDKPTIIKAQKLILYDGKHGDFPKKEFEKYVKDMFQ